MPEVIVSCDTSTSKFAVVVWIDGKPIDRKVFKTGETKVKKKLKSVTYFDNKIEQINWITNEVIKFIEPYKPQKVCLESLSFSSIGNQYLFKHFYHLSYSKKYFRFTNCFPIN